MRRGTPNQLPAREPTPMRYRLIAASFAAVCCRFCCRFGGSFAPAAKADDAPKDVKGLYLMSDYPAVTLRPGETSSISLRSCRIMTWRRSGLALSVSGVPAGWTATLMGGGQPMAAAMPATNSSVALSNCGSTCRRTRPSAPQTLTVTATGGSTNVHAADRGDACQGSAGEAVADTATCPNCAAPRNRASSISSASRTTAARS